MAKKKRKHRRPVAPPIHSAPSTAHSPGSPQAAAAPPPSRPTGAERPAAPIESATPPKAPRRRDAGRSRQAAKRRKSRRRTYVLLGAVVVLIAGLIVWQQVNSRREANEFNQLARSAGCGEIEETGASGEADHLPQGGTTKYDTSPPTHGPHDGSGTVPEGVYDEPFNDDPLAQPSIFRAVHSLEHGAIIVWHDRLDEDAQRALERRYRDEEKVIVVPYPQLRGDDHVVATGWGRMLRCEEASTRVIDRFVDRFRDAKNAPEAGAAI